MFWKIRTSLEQDVYVNPAHIASIRLYDDGSAEITMAGGAGFHQFDAAQHRDFMNAFTGLDYRGQ